MAPALKTLPFLMIIAPSCTGEAVLNIDNISSLDTFASSSIPASSPMKSPRSIERSSTSIPPVLVSDIFWAAFTVTSSTPPAFMASRVLKGLPICTSALLMSCWNTTMMKITMELRKLESIQWSVRSSNLCDAK